MRVDARSVILLFVVALTALSLMTTGDITDPPDDRVMCTDCHDDFEPFRVDVDVPAEVPTGEEFEVALTVSNDGGHMVKGLVVEMISLDPQYLILADGQNKVATYVIDGSLGFRDQVAYEVPVSDVHLEIRFDLSGTGGLMDTLLLDVTGPDGTSWQAGGSGMDGSITLTADDFETSGYGIYDVTVTHTRGVRSASFDLSITQEYGPDYMYEIGPDLGPGESHTFTFGIQGLAKGTGEVLMVVKGVAYHEHDGTGTDHRSFTLDETLVIEVGDELVGGGGSDGGGGGAASLLSAGQTLGFISAILLAGSLATSGHLPKLPKRGKVHCYISYALTGIFFVHWLTLWVGPYGSIYGGIVTGSVMMMLILVLAATGIRPKLMDGKLLGWSNRLLHRNVTYALVLVLVVHVLLNGSHFAFVRGG